MADNTEAKRLFETYTRNTGRIGLLYGPTQAARRAEIMTQAEVNRIARAMEQGRVGTYGVAAERAELLADLYPEEESCEYAPCSDCVRVNCPDRAE